MKKISSLFLVLVLMICCTGAGPCWLKQQYVPTPIFVPQQYMVYGYQYQYVPVIVQERVFVPIVQPRVEYLPAVGQFYMNYGHYYVVPSYHYQHNTWDRYGY